MKANTEKCNSQAYSGKFRKKVKKINNKTKLHKMRNERNRDMRDTLKLYNTILC